MKASKHHYSSHLDLARLDWFDIRDGQRLVLADPSLGPIVDSHTHLALAYGGPMRVDLHQRHPRTEHYLPLERPLDLDIYQNKNFLPSDLRRLTRDLTWRSITAGGMRRTHTLPNLLGEMAELGISHSVLLPIDFPLVSRNAQTYLEATRNTPEVVCFGSVHPYAWRTRDQLRRQKAMGARGVKIHPAVQMIYPDDKRAMRVYRECGELGLPVLWHCGPVDIEPPAGRRRSQVYRYERPIAETPEVTFVLGHSGALQGDVALELANRYPNVYLETASQSLPVIRTQLERGPTDRIMTGSDWPFYHQSAAIAKTLIATEGDEQLRRKVLYDNAANLYGLPSREAAGDASAAAQQG